MFNQFRLVISLQKKFALINILVFINDKKTVHTYVLIASYFVKGKGRGN